jgi:hypothetical protein
VASKYSFLYLFVCHAVLTQNLFQTFHRMKVESTQLPERSEVPSCYYNCRYNGVDIVELQHVHCSFYVRFSLSAKNNFHVYSSRRQASNWFPEARASNETKCVPGPDTSYYAPRKPIIKILSVHLRQFLKKNQSLTRKFNWPS